MTDESDSKITIKYGVIPPDARLSDGRLVSEAMDERIANPPLGAHEWFFDDDHVLHVQISTSRDADGNPIWQDVSDQVLSINMDIDSDPKPSGDPDPRPRV